MGCGCFSTVATSTVNIVEHAPAIAEDVPSVATPCSISAVSSHPASVLSGFKSMNSADVDYSPLTILQVTDLEKECAALFARRP